MHKTSNKMIFIIFNQSDTFDIIPKRSPVAGKVYKSNFEDTGLYHSIIHNSKALTGKFD
jgi:hypothetical protein